MDEYSRHISLALVATLGNFLGAEQVNSSHNLPEDEYLPVKRRKLSSLFVFFSKKKPVRWRAYWMHRVAQISFAVYLVILIVGRAVSQSYDFLNESVFRYYPFIMAFSRAYWELGIFVYVKIKLIKKRRENRKKVAK